LEVSSVRIPGWSAFLGRADRTWAGSLEPKEIRSSAIAYAWIIPIVPLLVLSLIAGLVLQFNGASTAASALPWATAVLYSALALLMWRAHIRKAQRLVARRLGIDDKAARKIDFRGHEKFERSIAQARAASSSS
jgi:hypothetical protein